MGPPDSPQTGAPVGGRDPEAPVIVAVKVIDCPPTVIDCEATIARVGVALGMMTLRTVESASW